MNRSLVLTGIGLVALAAATAGCGSDGRSAREFERMLPRLIGPAQRYEVRLSNASGNHLDAARVRIDRLQVESGPVLDNALVQFADVRFDRSRRELLSVDRAEFAASLLQEDLNAYLRERPSIVRRLRLRVTPDGAQLRGTADIPGLRLPIAPEFSMNGKLVIDDLGRLRFEPDDLRVAGIEAPSAAAKLLANQVNPLVDLTGGRLPVHLRSVETDVGEVRLKGRATVRTGIYQDLDLCK